MTGFAVSGAAIAAPALGISPALGAPDPINRRCRPIAPGTLPGAIAVEPDGRRLWVADSAGTTITAVSAAGLKRGHSINVGGAPIDIAVAPGGKLALVLTGFYDRPGLAFVNLGTGKVVRRIEVGPEPYALALAPGGRHAFVAGGGSKGTLTAIDVRARSATAPIPVGSHPLGVAATRGGTIALVTLNGGAGVALVDSANRRVVKTIPTDPFPCRVAISPSGARAAVTHGGLKSRSVTLIDLRRRRALRRLTVAADPFAIEFSSDSTMVVAGYGAAALSVIDFVHGRRRTARVGSRPRGIAVSPRGDRAYAVNEFDGSVSAIRLPRGRHGRKDGDA